MFSFLPLGSDILLRSYKIWEQEVGAAQGALDKVLYNRKASPNVSTGYS